MHIKELIQSIAKALVDNPEAVSVNEIEGAQTTVFELRVVRSDLGKVIGKQGRTEQTIRMILMAISARIKKRMVLEIVESRFLPPNAALADSGSINGGRI